MLVSASHQSKRAMPRENFDAVIVGAGFAGMYMLHKLRSLQMTAVIFEAGDDVGGTWYWNRYPGARCDAESLAYSFSFSPELEQEWQWSERYASQPEILDYARHVSQRFDLRKDTRFKTRVKGALFQTDTNTWLVQTDQGDEVQANFCIMATGCLSVPQRPDIPGLDDFKGNLYQASQWPHEPVSFADKTVGIIGTGSSGIQAIPVIAAEAEHLTVFQRTPNFSVPARNSPLDDEWVEKYKVNYADHRLSFRHGLSSGFGDLNIEAQLEPRMTTEFGKLSEVEANELLENNWRRGGAVFMGSIGDLMLNEASNAFARTFVHNKIKSIVKNPEVAELLCPTSHPIGTRRICVDINYYETYNRDNVTLVSVADHPIEAITPEGVQVNGAVTQLDTLVIATGFDAMTGALLNIDIRGRGASKLKDKWHAGPRAYLGLAMAEFPNLFTITGPGSPSVLSNMLVSIEQHVDWIADCLKFMQNRSFSVIEANLDAENEWVDHVNSVANATLFPRGGSWYQGVNIPGKPRTFMPYAGGVGPYRDLCESISSDDYRGFTFI
jgi:cyclohexanone monooxygenase